MANVSAELKQLEEKHAQEKKELIEKSMGPLQKERKSLAKQLAAVEKQITQLKELSGNGGLKKKSSTTITAAGSAKPKASDDIWLEILTNTLSDNASLTSEELFDLAKDKLGEKGFQTRGRLMPKMVRLVKKEARFTEIDGKHSLAKAAASK